MDDKEAEGVTVRVLRLSEAADNALRPHIKRKGDVSFQVNHAILGTNLQSVQVEPRSKAPGSGREEFFNTSVTFEPGVYKKVVDAAAEHGVSATALVDAVIIQYFQPKPKKGAKNVESDSSSDNKPKRRGG